MNTSLTTRLLRAGIIFQWALLLYLCGEAMLIIYAQTQLGGSYPRGCFPIDYSESISNFCILLAGFLITIGILKSKWLLLPYVVWTLLSIYVTSSIFSPFIPPISIWEIVTILYSLVCAVTSTFLIRAWIVTRQKTEQGAAANP